MSGPQPLTFSFKGAAWDRLEDDWVDVDGEVEVDWSGLEPGVLGHIKPHVIATGPDGEHILIFGSEFFDRVQKRMRAKIQAMH